MGLKENSEKGQFLLQARSWKDPAPNAPSSYISVQSAKTHSKLNRPFGLRPVGTGGLGWSWSSPPNNFQTVVYFLYNSVLNEEDNNGQLYEQLEEGFYHFNVFVNLVYFLYEWYFFIIIQIQANFICIQFMGNEIISCFI